MLQWFNTTIQYFDDMIGWDGPHSSHSSFRHDHQVVELGGEGLEIRTWTGRPYNSVVSLNHGERERDGECMCLQKNKLGDWATRKEILMPGRATVVYDAKMSLWKNEIVEIVENEVFFQVGEYDDFIF